MSKLVYGLILLFALFTEGLALLKLISPKTPKLDIARTPTAVAQVSKPQKFTIILTGDIMLGRSVMTHTFDSGDLNYPFINVAEKLKKADIVFSNLENPIVSDCPRRDSGMIFCADPRMLEGMIFAGIDVVNIANNHTMNYGQKGFDETKNFLTAHDISYTGDSNLAIKKIGGTTVGFLGFDYVTNDPSEDDLNLITNASQRVDILIVGVHWGSEYQAKAGKFQEETAIKMVDHGADVISGHHPHWVQNSTLYKTKPIYYSLGNFVFDQMWSENTKKGMAIRLTFKGDELLSQEELPVAINTLGQPAWVTPTPVKVTP